MCCLDLEYVLKCSHDAGDMESERCHLSGIIIRDLSCTVSNYRSTKTLDEYLKEQNVLGVPFEAYHPSACAQADMQSSETSSIHEHLLRPWQCLPSQSLLQAVGTVLQLETFHVQVS